MSGRIVNLSLAPRAWAQLHRDELLDLGRRLDASPVASLVLEDPDASDEPGPWRWDSSTGIGALVAVTRRIGLIVSVSSGYTEPFSASRRVGSLANLSAGRVGWLLDPGTGPGRDRRTRAVSPDLGVNDPHERTAELVAASRALWESWDDDALRLDVAANQLVDEARIRPVNFAGRHFRFAGQTNLRRPPGGNPPLYMRLAGSAEVGQAAALADVVLAASPVLADEVIAAARLAGRSRPPTVLLSGEPESIGLGLAHSGPVAGYDVVIGTPTRLDVALRTLAADGPAPTHRTDGLRAAHGLPRS